MRLTIKMVAGIVCGFSASNVQVRCDQKIPFGVELRERGEAWSNPDLNNAKADGGSYIYQRLRFHVKFIEKEKFEVFTQVQDNRAWGEKVSAGFRPQKNVAFYQGYVRFDKVFGAPLKVWVGRQELIYGEQRLVGNFNWGDGRSFDAVRFRGEGNKTVFEAFAAGKRDKNNAGFAGIYTFFNVKPFRDLHTYLFLLRDRQAKLGEVPSRGRNDAENFATLGARAAAKHLDARLEWNAEAAYQSGKRATNDHRAWAAYARGAWTFHKDSKSFITAELDAASGDGDSKDGKSQEFHNLYPTNHMRYGGMDFMGWRNTLSYRLGVSTTPKKWGTFAADVWFLGLNRAKGRWSSASGTTMGYDPTGKSGRHVGNEMDFTWKRGFQGGKVDFLAGYSYFAPGRFAKATRGGDKAQFGYIQMTVKLP